MEIVTHVVWPVLDVVSREQRMLDQIVDVHMEGGSGVDWSTVMGLLLAY